MPQPMTDDRRRAFLADRGRTAVIATTRADGRPHAVPIWYAADGDDILVNIGEDTVKGKALQRDPRVAIVVEDPEPPYAFVLVEGVADVRRSPDEVREGTLAIGRHYLDEQGAQGFAEYGTGPGKVLVRIRPTHTVAVDSVGA